MRTRAEILRIRNEIFTEIATNIDNYIAVNEDKIQNLVNTTDVESGITQVVEFLNIVTDIVKAPIVDGVSLPLFIAKIETTTTDVFKSFTLIVRSKIKATIQYKKAITINVNEKVVENIATALLECLFTMYFQEMALQNVEGLNNKLKQICIENNIPQTFMFTLNDSNNVINYIDNKVVVFNADIDKALDITKEGIFLCGDDYNNLICKETTDRLVELMQTCETTPQLVKGNIPLIKDITNLTTKKRASKLIRESYHRNAQALLNIKEGVGYFEKVINDDGIEIKIFSLIKKYADGTYEVILNPFDEITLFNIDYDVLKDLGIKGQENEA